MDQEHNFIKSLEEDYGFESESSSNSSIILTLILLFLAAVGFICFWLYNRDVTATDCVINVYKNEEYAASNCTITNKNDILNRNNIKKNYNYLFDIKYDEYADQNFNIFKYVMNHLDKKTLIFIWIAAMAAILLPFFLFGNNKSNVDDFDLEINFDDFDEKKEKEKKRKSEKKENENNNTYSIEIEPDKSNKVLDTNFDGDKLVINNNYYKYNKSGDNVFWNVVKKNKSNNNEDNLNINELSLMALKEIENGNDDEAINIYSKILDASDNILVLKNRALLFNKKYEETSDEEYFNAALKDYNKLIDLNNLNNNEDANIDTLKNRALLYTKKYHYTSSEDCFDAALNDYNRIVESNNKEDDLSTLLIYSDLYNEKYKNTHDKKYFKMSLKNYNKALSIDKNNISIYINRGWLYLTDYKITNDPESLNNAKKDIENGLNIEKDNFYLLNNNGIASLSRYKLEKQVKFLKESEYNFLQSIKNNKSNSVLAESYYYLSLVYDEYSKLSTITAEKINEYVEKSKHYLEESSKLKYEKAMNR